MITTALLIVAVCYLGGAVIRGLGIVAVAVVAVFFLRHMNALEIALAVGVIVFLAGKGTFSGLWPWLKSWQKPPEPPGETGA